MNSREAISGLVKPTAASVATWSSWGVRPPPWEEAGCRAVRPDFLEHVVSGLQALARITLAPLPAQPFAIQKLSASQMYPAPGVLQVTDRFPVEGLGVNLASQQGAGPGKQAQHQRCRAGRGAARDARHGLLSGSAFAT